MYKYVENEGDRKFPDITGKGGSNTWLRKQLT